MTSSGSQRRAEAWLHQAEYDLEAARLSLDHGYFEWSCFQAQQAAEKAAKGLLILIDGYAPRGHRVGGLLHVIGRLDPEAKEQLRVPTVNLEAITFVSRYPFAIPSEKVSPHEFIEKEDAVACLEEATTLCQRINQVKATLTAPLPN